MAGCGSFDYVSPVTRNYCAPCEQRVRRRAPSLRASTPLRDSLARRLSLLELSGSRYGSRQPGRIRLGGLETREPARPTVLSSRVVVVGEPVDVSNGIPSLVIAA